MERWSAPGWASGQDWTASGRRSGYLRSAAESWSCPLCPCRTLASCYMGIPCMDCTDNRKDIRMDNHTGSRWDYACRSKTAGSSRAIALASLPAYCRCSGPAAAWWAPVLESAPEEAAACGWRCTKSIRRAKCKPRRETKNVLSPNTSRCLDRPTLRDTGFEPRRRHRRRRMNASILKTRNARFCCNNFCEFRGTWRPANTPAACAAGDSPSCPGRQADRHKLCFHHDS